MGVAPRTPRIPNSVRWAVYKRDGYACVKCGATDDLTLDHIQRVVEGGDDSMENLRTLCRGCNVRRSRKSEGAQEYDPRRPRIPKSLAARVDGARGQVPFNRWVVRALEAALGSEESPSGRPDSQGAVLRRETAGPSASPRTSKPEKPEGETPLPSIARRRQW